MPPDEIGADYELNTGHSIVRRFGSIDPLGIPGVLVAGHAPFCWGKTPADAARDAVILESIAKLAFRTVALRSDAAVLERVLHDKHFLRKHGRSAYYVQLLSTGPAHRQPCWISR